MVLRLLAYHTAISFILQDVFLIFQIKFASQFTLSCKMEEFFTGFASYPAKAVFLYKGQLSDKLLSGHIASRKCVLSDKNVPLSLSCISS
jgi:hypothetical protein